MVRRLDISIVRNEFKGRGLVLKSTEYVGYKHQLEYVCEAKGHVHSMAYREFKQGAGCKTCTMEKMAADKRLSISDIRKGFAEKGCILKSTKYVGCNGKLDYICKRGHKHIISWNNFQLGYGCPLCDAEDKRHDIKYIKEVVEKRGWVLRSGVYTGAHDKLDYTCNKGHEHSMTWNNMRQGVGCPTCSKTEKAESLRHDIEFISKQFLVHGCVLESIEYVNAHTKLDYICKKGHKQSIRWADFQQGVRCKICDTDRKALLVGEKSPSWKGGYTRKQYCSAWYDKEYKLDIKQRDHHKCQNPYCKGNGGVLSIHHIDYNPMNCDPSNLIVLCGSCHGMSNAYRDWHTEYFQTLMNKKYNYTYTQV